MIPCFFDYCELAATHRVTCQFGGHLLLLYLCDEDLPAMHTFDIQRLAEEPKPPVE